MQIMQGNFHATYETYHSYICKYHLIICTLWIFILEMDAVMGGLTIQDNNQNIEGSLTLQIHLTYRLYKSFSSA